MTDDDNVTKLPVRFKSPLPAERTVMHLTEVLRPSTCSHLFATYLVSVAEAEVECGKCGTKLNPMWVLSQLAGADRRFADASEAHDEQCERLAERSRTKCQHCGKMTRISR